MPDTIVHTAEGYVDGSVAGLASALGSVTNEAAHHAQTLAVHGEKLTNIEADIAWIRTRLDDLAQTATAAPSSAIEALHAEMAQLRQELTEQTAALSEALTPEPSGEPQTQAPPPAHNEAEPPPPKGPLQRLRGALHRLL